MFTRVYARTSPTPLSYFKHLTLNTSVCTPPLRNKDSGPRCHHTLIVPTGIYLWSNAIMT